MSILVNTLQYGRRWTAVLIVVLILGGLWIWQTASLATATTGGLIPSPMRLGMPLRQVP